MKRLLMVLVMAMFVTSVTLAQGRGRGHGNGHDKHHQKHGSKHHDRDHGGRGERRDNDHRDHSWNYDRNHHGRHDHGHHRDYHYHKPVFSHQHSRHCDHRVVVRHYERPRYVYYRDYDLYYDYHRNVYVSYSGRSWTVSVDLPRHIHHVDLRSATCHQVDYYEDDLPVYLGYGRPMYGEVYIRR